MSCGLAASPVCATAVLIALHPLNAGGSCKNMTHVYIKCTPDPIISPIRAGQWLGRQSTHCWGWVIVPWAMGRMPLISSCVHWGGRPVVSVAYTDCTIGNAGLLAPHADGFACRLGQCSGNWNSTGNSRANQLSWMTWELLFSQWIYEGKYS